MMSITICIMTHSVMLTMMGQGDPGKAPKTQHHVRGSEHDEASSRASQAKEGWQAAFVIV